MLKNVLKAPRGLLPGLGVLTLMTAGNAAVRGALTDRNMAGEGLLGGTSFARGDFYGIDSLVTGEPFPWQLSTSTSGTAIGLFSFGFGFNGGLIYSPAELAFYTIDELLALGPGFVSAGLTIGSNSVPEAPRPELSAFLLLGVGLTGIALMKQTAKWVR